MSLPSTSAPAARPARRARRCLFAAVLLAAGLLPSPQPAHAGDGRPSWTAEQERTLNDGRRRAIRRGCDWIASRKNPGGSFGEEKAIVALTALSTLALMAGGSSMNRGPHGEDVKRGIEFLVNLVEHPAKPEVWPDGFFYAPQDTTSKMHGQGYAMLALATALGSADKDDAPRIKAVLESAARCAEGSQTGTGGWGYMPDRAIEHEGSVTVTVAQGLRAARDAGVHVSRDTVWRGLEYLRKSQRNHPPGSAQEDWDGSFKYSISTDRSTYALTAAALSSFYLFGEYGSRPEDKDRIDRGIRFLKRSLPRQMARSENRLWHFYGHFYAAFTAWQRDGDEPGPLPGETWGDDPRSGDILRTEQLWGPWHVKVFPDYLRTQRQDGAWEDPTDPWAFGELLPTSFAVLTLSIPDEQIPLFQR